MEGMEYGDPEEKERTEQFKKDEREEMFIREFNAFLVPFEEKLSSGSAAPKFPVGFIVGLPRCGSTLMMQLAVTTYELGYPSNLMARFFKAPSVGAWLQKIIIGKMKAHRSKYESSYGVTDLPEEPHEFGYFWTSFFKPGLTHYFDSKALDQVDTKKLICTLGSIEAVFRCPLIFKSLNIDFLIEFLHNCLPKTFFIYVKRDLYYMAESIYLARISRYGSPDAWWSLRPRQYQLIKELDNYHQVAGQVWAVKAELERQLEKVPELQKMEVWYDELCADPEQVLIKYANKMQKLGCPLNRIGGGIAPLKSRDNVKLPEEDSLKLRSALEEMREFMEW